ncbi:MAG TPA: FKBP-type peptidyl-prolyl cis-trans isomerase [Rhodoglobus sp.]|nr:FKBP-type peptidyl-prolyl cis-trans isomerase [Rhodoglobus sp.]
MFVRKLPAILATAGLLVSLSACTGAPFSSACTPAFPSGANSALVTADGAVGTAPKTTFPTPLVAKSTEVTELVKGDGAIVAPGDVVDFQVTALLGSTGEVLTASSYDKTKPVRRTVGGSDALGQMLQCASVGSRVASAASFESIFPDVDPSTAGVKATDTIVLVLDAQRVFPGRATGADQLAPAGFPSVVLAPNGQPGFTFGSSTPREDLAWAALKQGNGAVVKKGDVVVAQVTGVVWGASTVFTSTWDDGNPVNVTAASTADDPNGVPPGWAKALIGQKVGSQVIVSIPPSEGYASGSAPTGVSDGDTIVLVFDILGIL